MNVAVESVPRAKLSRGTRQHIMKRRAAVVRANEGVAAINDILYNADSLGAGNAEVSALRDRFLRRNQSFDLWSHVPDPEEALRTLLGSSPGYSAPLLGIPIMTARSLYMLLHMTGVSLPCRSRPMLRM